MSLKLVAIDTLHTDALREILIHVAGSPNGAANLARAFAVCKAFQKFSEDGDVLRAVVFDNLPVSRRSIPFSTPELEERNSQEFSYVSVYTQYEPFQHVGGLINRSAQAGHPDAQFILAKIVMVSASELYNAKQQEAANSEAFLGDDNFRRRRAEVSSFVADFSTKSTVSERASPGSLSCSNLVRMFLTRASSIEFENMRPFLKDFVQYFLDPKKEAHYQQFLLLFKMLSKGITHLLEKSEAICDSFNNDISTKSRKALLALGIDPQQLRDLALFEVQKNDYDVGAEKFMKQMEIVEVALLNGGIQGDNDEQEQLDNAVFFVCTSFRLPLKYFAMYGSSIKKHHAKMIVAFDALFSISPVFGCW